MSTYTYTHTQAARSEGSGRLTAKYRGGARVNPLWSISAAPPTPWPASVMKTLTIAAVKLKRNRVSLKKIHKYISIYVMYIYIHIYIYNI